MEGLYRDGLDDTVDGIVASCDDESRLTEGDGACGGEDLLGEGVLLVN